MTSPADIPLSSVPWLLGAAGTLMLGVKGLLRYRSARVELSKYIAWFAISVGLAMAFFSIPSFFTLNTSVLRSFNIVGEAFFYGSMVAQAAIVWFLLLRPRFSPYYLTIPVALIGLASWLNGLFKVRVNMQNNFLYYHDPRPSTIVIACLMIGLFTPVGVYFLRLVPRQKGLKSVLNALAFGLVYLGTAFISGGFELLTGQMVTPASVPGLIGFFIILLLAAAWPRRLDAKSTVQIPAASSAATPAGSDPPRPDQDQPG